MIADFWKKVWRKLKKEKTIEDVRDELFEDLKQIKIINNEIKIVYEDNKAGIAYVANLDGGVTAVNNKILSEIEKAFSIFVTKTYVPDQIVLANSA